MRYTLPDGRGFELEQVTRVSKIRDHGEDTRSIEYSKLSFHIHLHGDEVLEVVAKYHYADWAEQKKKLSQIRKELLTAIRESGIEVDDT